MSFASGLCGCNDDDELLWLDPYGSNDLLFCNAPPSVAATTTTTSWSTAAVEGH